jgi:hypothetical protein
MAPSDATAALSVPAGDFEGTDVALRASHDAVVGPRLEPQDGDRAFRRLDLKSHIGAIIRALDPNAGWRVHDVRDAFPV